MVVGQISGVSAVSTAASASETGARLPAAGRELRVAVQSGTDGRLDGLTEDGLALLLTGLSEAGVVPGDVLRMRVLQSGDRLELELLDIEKPAVPAESKPPMSPTTQLPRAPDPTVLGQIGWQRPDASRLAAAWRVLVLGRLAGAELLNEQAQGQHLPASLLQAVLPRGLEPWLSDNAAEAVAATETWWFAAHAWHGQPIRLGIEGDEEDTAGSWDVVDLLLEAELPGLGWLLLCLQPRFGGVLLTLTAETPEAVLRIRAQSARLARTLRQSSVKLRGWRLRLGPVRSRPLQPPRLSWQRVARQLAPELFSLAAEVLLVLAEKTTEQGGEEATQDEYRLRDASTEWQRLD